MHSSRNRAQKLLGYLADMVVNGSQIMGQKGQPGLRDHEIEIPTVLPAHLPTLAWSEPCRPEQGGFRQIFLTKGPEAFAKAIRRHKGTLIMDTTWRDAHQSLLATRLRTIDIAKIAPLTSHCFKNMVGLRVNIG